MAIDFRTINPIIESSPYPIPDIKQILQLISGKNYYTVLDFHSAFFQINLRPEDTEKLAFITEEGKFNPLRLPFGTKISTSVFAQLIDTLLGHFDKGKVQYFIDDVILASDTEEEMLALIQEVLQVLVTNNLTIDPKKMQICKSEINFLGFKINQNGHSPSNKNIEKVQNLARPKSKKAVMSILGCFNYFRGLVNNYAEIVNPLVELTKSKTKFKWSVNEEKAFQTMQEAILRNPTVKAPDFSKEFFLITDASTIALSGILAQQHNDLLIPIEFYARKLKGTEMNYPSMKLELLAIHDAIFYFRNILIGRKFTILTDSKSLTYNLHLEQQNGIVARWVMNLMDFDFKIEYIEGTLNPADYNSRYLVNNIDKNNLTADLFKINSELSKEKIKYAQLNDNKICKIIQEIQKGKNNKTTRNFDLNMDGILILKKSKKSDNQEMVITPSVLQHTVMEEAHKPHFGFHKTYQCIKNLYYWTGMYRDIKKFCANCTLCQTNKQHTSIPVPIQKPQKEYSAGSTIMCDIVGKLPYSLKNNCFILTIIDCTSRFLQAIPLKNIDSQNILAVLNNYFSTFGLPKILHSDNAGYFKSKIFKEYMKKLGIEIRYGSVWHPQSQSLLEITHKMLKNSIAAMAKETYEWEERLLFFILHYNTSIHRSLGVSPALIFFARELRTPFSAHLDANLTDLTTYVQKRVQHMQEVKKIALQSQENVHREYDKRNINKKDVNLDLGQTVYVKIMGNHPVFGKRYEGPYEITKRFRNKNFLLTNIEDPQKKCIKRHISQLYAPKHADSAQLLNSNVD